MAIHTKLQLCYLLAVAGLLISTIAAQDNNSTDDQETQDPDYNCLGGPAFGLNSACDFNNFDGLQGHGASEILYEILQQAKTPNDTFFANGSHVTCLFKDTNFLLDFSAGANAGPAQVGFNIKVPQSGTVCVYVEDVPGGGLTLGKIRELSRALIDKCGKCGRMTVNYLSKNETDLGYLKFNWQDPATCQSPCIDPSRDLKTSNTTNTSATHSSAADRIHGGHGWSIGYGATPLVVSTAAFLLGFVVVLR